MWGDNFSPFILEEIMKKLYLHKNGNLYEILSIGLLEVSLESMVTYRDIETGIIWVRPAKEFFDGRFEEVYRKVK